VYIRRVTQAIRLGALVAGLILFGAACTRQASVQERTVQPTAAAVRQHATPRPESTRATILPTSVPSPERTVEPAASPTVAPGPAIYSVSATPKIARAGDTIVWNVRTSGDVTAVDAKATGFTIPLARQGPGRFSTAFVIPGAMPPIFRGTYNVEIEARTASGKKARSQLSLRIE
jgi:hypothetical protein